MNYIYDEEAERAGKINRVNKIIGLLAIVLENSFNLFIIINNVSI